MSEEKIPVFERAPTSESSLSECLGWVDDERQACELLLKESDEVKKDDGVDIPEIGKMVFGGVMKGHLRVATDSGQHRDAKGLYRWQPCLYPFYDTEKNAGSSTPLDHLYIYQR